MIYFYKSSLEKYQSLSTRIQEFARPPENEFMKEEVVLLDKKNIFENEKENLIKKGF